MRVYDIPKFDQLSTPEKLLLLEDIWDTIQSAPSSLPVPESHTKELDERMEKYKANPGNVLTLEELRGNIDSRK